MEGGRFCLQILCEESAECAGRFRIWIGARRRLDFAGFRVEDAETVVVHQQACVLGDDSADVDSPAALDCADGWITVEPAGESFRDGFSQGLLLDGDYVTFHMVFAPLTANVWKQRRRFSGLYRLQIGYDFEERIDGCKAEEFLDGLIRSDYHQTLTLFLALDE